MNEAVRILDGAEAQGITLRMMGALAVRYHSMEFSELHKKLGRLANQEFTDVDYMSYSKHAKSLERFFDSIGYSPNRAAKLMGVVWQTRHIYEAPKGFHVDVFLDRLEMSHTLDFRGRLELDKPTISLADLLLEKMQIVQINEKDIKDCIVLLRAHSIGSSNSETIDVNYVADLLSKNWGLYYTVTTNLNRIRELTAAYDALTEEDRRDVNSKVERLLELFERQPKSASWKIRAKIGAKKKWYTDVEETFSH